jgi:uncharacterized coiled-coil DUF342 family protein
MNQEQITAKLSQINSKGLETSFSLSEAALENAQKLAELNYAASKDALVNAQDSIQQVLTAKDPKQVTELLSAETLQSAGDQAAAYQKKVSELVNQVIIYEAKITSLSSAINELTTENDKLKKPKRGTKSEGDFE